MAGKTGKGIIEGEPNRYSGQDAAFAELGQTGHNNDDYGFDVTHAETPTPGGITHRESQNN